MAESRGGRVVMGGRGCGGRVAAVGELLRWPSGNGGRVAAVVEW